MKTHILCLLLLSPSSFALTPKQVIGKYSATSKTRPGRNIITFSTVNRMTIEEENGVTCHGTWSMKKDIITNHLTCDDNGIIVQTISLVGVTNLNRFTAKFITLQNKEVPIEFERIP